VSYDLFFRARPGKTPASAVDFANYFQSRPRYDADEEACFYSNEDTGVYFNFALGDTGNEDEPDLLPISFNINYVRPHIFGLEAEPELISVRS
jgi:hypothetical protein